MNATTRRLRPAALSAGLVAALLAITACSGGSDEGDETAPGTPTPTVSSTPSPSPTAGATDAPTGSTDDDGSTSAPPFPANTEPDTSEPSAGAALTVTDVRVGRHDGFDRVVFELGGTGTPGWRVEYVPEAIEDGKGDVIDVDGDGTLQVMISGSGYPMDTGVAEYAGPNPLRVAETDEVEEVVLRGVFEGYTQAFIGTDDADNPFRVYALTDPARVVVEVRDDA
ncbi:hypothetical protein EQW78_03930 [Oerskovia turbata]|uniref:AMIN-like domain-containing protein n=1 Tax=Oerskovia turbata TaxID=1713 RepID=A0A4V1N5K0_9CELL|nr:hypothetical protein [Oerskovia turbata]RXR28055.1 hypothetical protein EQW73_01825 [Oerskovia turbata]RXR35936.1 hypothetical protein EQW78_03930 [Oerskovia turbata]TGJ94849.1 hypothetical protein DLJ96_17555 [Actinotalea fermentans ATCC 43279 = JCM 9966 = DSM 3133]